MMGLYDALAEVSADNTCSVVILTGEGRGFCSGLDLEDPGAIPGVEQLAMARIGLVAMRHYSKIVPAMREIPQPIIAAINGCAYGGGLCLSLGADIRIAGESTIFNSTGIVNGLTSTELGISYLLPRLIGAARSTEILLSGRVVEAIEAEHIGLVSRVVPDEKLLDTAIELAEGMCKFSPYGLSMTKRVCWANLEATSLTAAIDLEDRNQLMLGITGNLPECIQARKQNRQPVYKDLPRTDLGGKY